ncbi:NAD(P)-dependent oxidoreductase [Pengzhenrongella sicca]|uniref:Phosphoglycerate dehydrogenase n=1 Tax=Pengzhenrongella sicca TaxID=2819238 RepID=A0A8A4ZB49_9MICO|nr:NAD(P)-dependent oxidoreductase [Pengzhenrongella sicca]QTE28645.1 phosphoglycerate dehydrogenase [Pengzhenrongella sicca]
MSFTLLLPTSLPLTPEVPAGVVVVPYAVDEPLPAAIETADAMVVWGNPAGQLRDAAARGARLRWVQALAAGPDAVLGAGFVPGAVITSGRSLHDGPVAEHALALVLAAARRLNLLVRAQTAHRWAAELGGLQPGRPADSFRTLAGARVLVWGFGSIAQALAPHLRLLGAEVTGVASSAGERVGFPVIAAADVEAALPTTDLLIGILPATADTHHAISAERLALLPAHAWVVNVGRGTTLDEAALARAVHEGRLGGAALDVFEIEPLPADSPLWDEPNVIVSPHAAGGRPTGASELVSANLAALLAGQPLRNVVAR